MKNTNVYCDVTAVIITYNEEERIESCIRSIIDVFSKSGLKYEIILVDSSSEDRTISIAEKYPIKIISLKRHRSPSLGQYVGFINSEGDAVMFIDGDMELIMDSNKISYFLDKLDDKVAGLQGYFIDYQADGSKSYHNMVNRETEVSFLSGYGLYSRASLLKETFNPFLYSNEERDLGYRLKDEGFSLLRIPVAMVNHYRRESSSGLSEILRRYRNNFFKGSGQIFRSQKTLSSFFRHLYYYKFDFIFSFSLVLLFLSLFYYNENFIIAILFSHFFLISYYKFRYGNIGRYFLKYFISWGILTGFLTYRKHKIEYEVIRSNA